MNSIYIKDVFVLFWYTLYIMGMWLKTSLAALTLWLSLHGWLQWQTDQTRNDLFDKLKSEKTNGENLRVNSNGYTCEVVQPTQTQRDTAQNAWITPPPNMGVAVVTLTGPNNISSIDDINSGWAGYNQEVPVSNGIQFVLSRNADSVNQYLVIETTSGLGLTVLYCLKTSADGEKITSIYADPWNPGFGALLDNLTKPEAIVLTDTLLPCGQTPNGFWWNIPLTNRSGTGLATSIIVTRNGLPLPWWYVDNQDSVFIPYNSSLEGDSLEIHVLADTNDVVHYDSLYQTGPLPAPSKEEDILAATNSATIVPQGNDDFTRIRLTNTQTPDPMTYTFTSGSDIYTHTFSTPSVDYDLPNDTIPRIYTISLETDNCSNIPLWTIATPVNTITSTDNPEKAEKLSFSIYPNPVSNTFFIDTKNIPHANRITWLSIYDMTGNIIHKEDIYDNGYGLSHKGINTNAMSNGVYIVEIETKEWPVNKKLVINHQP